MIAFRKRSGSAQRLITVLLCLVLFLGATYTFGYHFAVQAANTNFSSNLTSSSSTWARPVPSPYSESTFTAISSGTGSYYYDVTRIQVSATGNYSMTVTSTVGNSDTMLYVYSDGFDVAHPTSNFIIGNDDAGMSLHSKIDSVHLEAGNTYCIVLTTYSAGTTSEINFNATPSDGGSGIATDEFTISFDSNGGSAVDPIIQTYGTTVTAPADPTREGYTFIGWDSPVPATMIDTNVTLTALWMANPYTIFFNSDGGTPVADILQDYDTPITFPADPTRDGYTFMGWDPLVPEMMPLGGAELTAQWSVSAYTICFDSVGGSPVADILQDYDTPITPPSDPTRDGYTFISWDPLVPEMMPLGGAELTAQWAIIPTQTPTETPTTTPTVVPTASPTPTTGILGTDRLTPVPNRVLDIRGTLLDANGLPISGYTIELHSDPVVVVTDANGSFAIQDTTLETHTFIVKNAAGEVLKTFTFNVTTGEPFSWTQVDGVTYYFYIDTNTIGIDITVKVDGANVTISAVNAMTNPKTGDSTGNPWMLFLALPIAMVAVCLTTGRKQSKRRR